MDRLRIRVNSNRIHNPELNTIAADNRVGESGPAVGLLGEGSGPQVQEHPGRVVDPGILVEYGSLLEESRIWVFRF